MSDVESDSDGAPEDVSFKAGKEMVENSQKEVARSIRSLKEREKDKRRKRHEQNKIQKEQKVLAQVNRLPSNILQSVPETLPAPKMIKKRKTVKNIDSEQRSMEDISELSAVKKASDKKQRLDYIPLECPGPTEFGLVPLEVTAKKMRPDAKNLANFKHEMLYGKRIQREKTAALLQYREKRKAVGNDKF